MRRRLPRTRTPQVNPALIKLEREISSIADRIYRRTQIKRVGAYFRSELAAAFTQIKRIGADFRYALGAAFAQIKRIGAYFRSELAAAFTQIKRIGADFRYALGAALTQITLIAARFRNAFVSAFQISRQKLQFAITNSRNWTRIAVASLRRLASGIRSSAQSRTRKTSIAMRSSAASSQTIRSGARANMLERALISVCFGLLIVAGILVAVLYLHVKTLKTELAIGERRVAAITARLNQLEKLNEQKPAKDSAPTELPHLEIALSKADLNVIRQFIKVLPRAPGAEQKIHLGDDVSNITAIPVPESLVEQVPKLRGARFSIDQNNAIILIGDGSKRADAIITPN